jgi:hypothetical protein
VPPGLAAIFTRKASRQAARDGLPFNPTVATAKKEKIVSGPPQKSDGLHESATIGRKILLIPSATASVLAADHYRICTWWNDRQALESKGKGGVSRQV